MRPLKNQRKLRMILVALLMFLFAWTSLAATNESRNIYIGDEVTFIVDAMAITKDGLSEALKDFEILNLQEKKNVYEVTVRTFQPGDYSINLGNTELLIKVASTLEDFQRDTIFEGDLKPWKAKADLHWLILYGIAGLTFLVTVVNILLKVFRNRKERSLSPYDRFLGTMKGLDFSQQAGLVTMTKAFKTYIESTYDVIICGKTTEEILAELMEISPFHGDLQQIHNWLQHCDALKFRGQMITEVDQEHLRQDMLSIVNAMNEKRGVTS